MSTETFTAKKIYILSKDPRRLLFEALSVILLGAKSQEWTQKWVPDQLLEERPWF